MEYEIKEGNGYIKEYYYDDKLKFEGEYLNGERNGKGKEYYFDDRLQFEGEYLNGKRNGKGKEYYYGGELKFEGEYLNGNKWNGKGYNKNDNIEFEIKDEPTELKTEQYLGNIKSEYILKHIFSYINQKEKFKYK